MALIKCHECGGQVSDQARRWLVVLFTFAAISTFAQLSAPSLEQIKIAADAGDAAAQDKLAEQYLLRSDTADAEVWYRKAADQGYAHAQGQLGHMLLMRGRLALGINPQQKAALEDEGLKWAMLAANQGDVQGQADMAGICLEGKLVKQDLEEAYKWGDLAARGSPFNPASLTGQSIRNAAVLKMNADEIADAKRRVAEFKPHILQKSEMPEPAWVKDIKLKGINDSPGHRTAIINDQVFEQSDANVVKVGGRSVKVKCLEISTSSVRISIEGIEGERELRMPDK